MLCSSSDRKHEIHHATDLYQNKIVLKDEDATIVNGEKEHRNLVVSGMLAKTDILSKVRNCMIFLFTWKS